MHQHQHSKFEIGQWLRGMHDYAREIDQSYLLQAAELLSPVDSPANTRPESKRVLVAPETLTAIHICDGEQIITGDDDGQAWVATFASAISAANYLELMLQQGKAIYAERNADTPAKPTDPREGIGRGKVQMWDAINEYAAACGADTSANTISDRRMRAVSAIEALMRWALV